MKFIRREEKIKLKKGRKRVRIAIFFLAILLIISTLGYLIKSFRQNDFFLFQSEKILKPMTGISSERELVDEFSKTDVRVISLSIIGEKELEASISGGTKILLKTEKIAQQVSSLQLMLSRFKIEGRIPKKIDLRFEKPIVVF